MPKLIVASFAKASEVNLKYMMWDDADGYSGSRKGLLTAVLNTSDHSGCTKVRQLRD